MGNLIKSEILICILSSTIIMRAARPPATVLAAQLQIEPSQMNGIQFVTVNAHQFGRAPRHVCYFENNSMGETLAIA